MMSLALIAVGAVVLAQGQEQAGPKNVANMSLEELMTLEVVTATKSPRSMWSTASATFVLTSDDIARAGVRSLPDALRLIPGVTVAQTSASQWMVGMRGFTSRYANKLLVMVDGASIYTPFFSGVDWDIQTLGIRDIDRIEVIRGPGGALWGANAVDGIINIITKKPDPEAGNEIVGGASSYVAGSGAAIVQGALGANAAYRLSVSGRDQRGFPTDAVDHAADSWKGWQASGRLDWGTPETGSFGINYRGASSDFGMPSRLPTLEAPYYEEAGGHFANRHHTLIGKWDKQNANGSTTHFQLYGFHTDRKQLTFHEERTTVEANVEMGNLAFGSHNFALGLGARTSRDTIAGSDNVMLDPESDRKSILNFFIQDEYASAKDTKWIVGLKLERNDDTGWEYQPSLRWIRTPRREATYWASVSRAVRTPSRAELGSTINLGVTEMGGFPVLQQIHGSPDFQSSTVVAYEAGLRSELTPTSWLDAVVYYNDYRGLRSFEQGEPMLVPDLNPYFLVPITFANKMDVRTYGLEVAFFSQPSATSRLRAGMSWNNAEFRWDADSADGMEHDVDDRPGNSPRLSGFLWTGFDLGKYLKLDGIFRHYGGASKQSPYSTVDVNLSWQSGSNLSVTIGAQNLFLPRHSEGFTDLFEVTSQVPRTFYGFLTWRF